MNYYSLLNEESQQQIFSQRLGNICNVTTISLFVWKYQSNDHKLSSKKLCTKPTLICNQSKLINTIENIFSFILNQRLIKHCCPLCNFLTSNTKKKQIFQQMQKLYRVPFYKIPQFDTTRWKLIKFS